MIVDKIVQNLGIVIQRELRVIQMTCGIVTSRIHTGLNCCPSSTAAVFTGAAAGALLPATFGAVVDAGVPTIVACYVLRRS